jgi:hypothetical protein
VVLGGPARRLQAEGDRRGRSAQGMAGTAIDTRASLVTASGRGMRMLGGATPVVVLADPDHYRRPQFTLSKSLPQLGDRQQGHVEPHSSGEPGPSSFPRRRRGHHAASRTRLPCVMCRPTPLASTMDTAPGGWGGLGDQTGAGGGVRTCLPATPSPGESHSGSDRFPRPFRAGCLRPVVG